MKKPYIFLITSIILVICFGGIYSYADENADNDTFYTRTTYLKEHFDAIEDHVDANSFFPENVVGSCSYVSMSLLLSFYDAYWRDELVPDNYETIGLIDERNSKITLQHNLKIENSLWKTYKSDNNIDENTEAGKDAYEQFILSLAGDYFHPYLMYLGVALGYPTEKLDYGLSDDEMVSFLRHYLYNIRNLNSSKIEVHIAHLDEYTTKDDLFEITKNQIKQGFPVIYIGFNTPTNSSRTLSDKENEFTGHCLLAYTHRRSRRDILDVGDRILRYGYNICRGGTRATNKGGSGGRKYTRRSCLLHKARVQRYIW